jgi:hypothetical protein
MKEERSRQSHAAPNGAWRTGKRDFPMNMSRLPALAELHASANSSGSRRASGDSPFSASSRRHASTSLSASRRFAFASARVSPCEMVAGTSSTKQVYPPSFAGSKIAVSFMAGNCCATLRSAALSAGEPHCPDGAAGFGRCGDRWRPGSPWLGQEMLGNSQFVTCAPSHA